MTPTTGSRGREKRSDARSVTPPLQHHERRIAPLREPIAFCFSGGKDSAMALWEIQRRGEYRVEQLITTVTDAYDRVSMHGVRRGLLRRQTESLDLPLVEVAVPPEPSNAAYEQEMAKAFCGVRDKGIRRVAFGDVFLEDLRNYRERQLSSSGLTCLFPLWKKPTRSLARTFIKEGFRAITVCVDSRVLDESFAGRLFDEEFLCALPGKIDPCGENGEFHTFVFDGPIFSRPIEFTCGETVKRDGFLFCDLL